MRKIWLSLFFYIFVCQLFAQQAQMEVAGTPSLSQSDIITRRLPNAKYCAGIRIISALDHFSYDSEIGIVKYIDNPGKDILYLDPNDRYVTAYHVGYEPLRIYLSEFGIQLKEREMWNIKIMGGKVDILPVSFVLEPKDTHVKINSKDMGSGPTFQLRPDTYSVEVSKEGYYTQQDSFTVTPNRVIFNYYLAKKPEMVFVEGGTFDMGDTFGDGYSDEKPVHKVTLNSFYIGKYEVTFTEYDVFCNATGRELPGDCLWGRENRPVINVSWYDAVEFCNWLSEQEGLSTCYTIDKSRKDPNNTNSSVDVQWLITCDFSANGYRLPTEAEWEYACRGGSRSAQYKYAGSNTADEVAWYRSNADSKTHPAGQKKPNELGIYDMSGNICEWCWDWYGSDYYSSSPSRNPLGPEKGSSRVRRGGSWYYDGGSVRSADRYYDHADYRDSGIGFRLLRNR